MWIVGSTWYYNQVYSCNAGEIIFLFCFHSCCIVPGTFQRAYLFSSEFLALYNFCLWCRARSVFGNMFCFFVFCSTRVCVSRDFYQQGTFFCFRAKDPLFLFFSNFCEQIFLFVFHFVKPARLLKPFFLLLYPQELQLFELVNGKGVPLRKQWWTRLSFKPRTKYDQGETHMGVLRCLLVPADVRSDRNHEPRFVQKKQPYQYRNSCRIMN